MSIETMSLNYFGSLFDLTASSIKNRKELSRARPEINYDLNSDDVGSSWTDVGVLLGNSFDVLAKNQGDHQVGLLRSKAKEFAELRDMSVIDLSQRLDIDVLEEMIVTDKQVDRCASFKYHRKRELEVSYG